MKLIDSHCHLNAEQFRPRISKIISDAKEVGVTGFILPGVIASSWQEQLQLASRHSGVYCAAGLHPLFLEQHHNRDLTNLEELCRRKLLVAIGEIGLDFYHGKEQAEAQQQLFEEQLKIATRVGLSVMLHVRKAHDQVLATLRRKQFTGGGCVHAFNGSLQQAKQYIGLGFAIGVGGAATYVRAKKIRTVAAQLPEESIVLETDSPDMLIAGKDKGPNLPEYLVEILHVLAKLRQTKAEHLGEITRQNTQRLFKLS